MTPKIFLVFDVIATNRKLINLLLRYPTTSPLLTNSVQRPT